MHLLLITHALPLWFLIVALFLPRIALLIAWYEGTLGPFHLQSYGWAPLIVAIVVPRVLVLVLIYQDLGLGVWFLLHLIALVMVWGGSHRKRWRRRDD